ncbi:DUF2513 domain-containing protein [Tindallia californiensis]|uniref:DUF2513 domain-containing protein n=1 Tax=Tindallia californiensis TaxID=159292 RepID=A0A1H3R2T5_9FIRM|nr:DUF2513 domain-containing protein [Tindallia californiensis]SDZ19621.1 Hypothetical protein SAMN05192546_11190 [Tindallia californiensis]
MERDMDLVRKVLIEVEKEDSCTGIQELKVDGYSREQISYHIMILDQAGLIKAKDFSNHNGSDWKAMHLTWQGHEFLEAAKDDEVWQKAKDTIKKKGGQIAFSVLKLLLIKIMEAKYLNQ